MPAELLTRGAARLPEARLADLRPPRAAGADVPAAPDSAVSGFGSLMSLVCHTTGTGLHAPAMGPSGCALYAPGQDLYEHVSAGERPVQQPSPEPRAQVRILPGAPNLLPGALNRTCSRTNADRALRTDLHLYSEAVGFVRHSPARVPMSWAPTQLIARPHGKTTARGAVPAPTSQPDPGHQAPILRPVQPATHPCDRRDELQQAAQWCL